MRTLPDVPTCSTPIAVSVAEACRIGNFGNTKAYELIRAGKLKVTKAAGRTSVLYASLVDLLQPTD